MRAKRIAETLAWCPFALVMPIALSVDRAIVAAQDITAALRNPAPPPPHLAPVDDRRRNALQQLANIFADQQPLTILPGFQPLPD